MISRERWCPVLDRLVVILLLLLCASSCAQQGSFVDVEAEARFREMFGSSLTDELVLATNNRKYHNNEIIDYWVENNTDQTLWFEDQSFGIRSFAYDEAAKQWVQVDLGFRVSEPIAKSIESGGGGVLDFYVLSADRIALPEDGRIRLVITGHTDLTNPVLDRIYVGYADVEVVK